MDYLMGLDQILDFLDPILYWGINARERVVAFWRYQIKGLIGGLYDRAVFINIYLALLILP